MTATAAIFGCAGPQLTPPERAFFADAQPWGFILFARNCETPDQVRRLTGDLRAAVGRDAPVLVDQEGGRVQRMGPPHWRQYLPPLDQMQAAGSEGPLAMYLRMRLIAEELRAVGIDVNCAPSGDIASADTHPFLSNRCYGSDARAVTDAALSAAEGLMDGGVLPVFKHMPGHGRAIVDSHAQLPRVAEPVDVLEATDFAPFRALSHLPMGMTAHVVYEALDPDRAATVSPVMVRYMREQIGFGGLLMTDDLSMEALSGDVADRAARARAAGVDLALHCNGDLAQMRRVAEAAGAMGPQTETRATAALDARRKVRPIDIAATEAELEALLSGALHG